MRAIGFVAFAVLAVVASAGWAPSARRCLSCLVLTETIRQDGAESALLNTPETYNILNANVGATCTVIGNYITTNVAHYPLTTAKGSDHPHPHPRFTKQHCVFLTALSSLFQVLIRGVSHRLSVTLRRHCIRSPISEIFR